VGTRKQPVDWWAVGGAGLLLWAAANTLLSVHRYGLSAGMYWWFCNLAMVGTGAAIWLRHRGWLVGFLSIALFTQTFWIVDNVWRIATGENLLGLVEFMYQPGNPFDEFLVSHYHFFIIPTALFALFHLRHKHDLPVPAVIATNAFIFGLSYFAFPASQNVNCIHEPCLWSLEHWKGPVYSIVFPSIVCLGCLGMMAAIRRAHDRLRPTRADRALALKAYVAVCALGLLVTLVDIRYKLSLPAFACTEAPAEAQVEARCRFTLEHGPREMSLSYRLSNQGTGPAVCSPALTLEGNFVSLGGPVYLAPSQSMDLRGTVPYPAGRAEGYLRTGCSPPAPPKRVLGSQRRR